MKRNKFWQKNDNLEFILKKGYNLVHYNSGNAKLSLSIFSLWTPCSLIMANLQQPPLYPSLIIASDIAKKII